MGSTKKAHRNFTDMFQHSWKSFSIRRVIVCEHTVDPSSGYFPKLLAFPQWPFKSLSCLPLVPLNFSIAQN